MADRNNVHDLSVAMATETVDDVTQVTAAGATTSSHILEFYFQCAVVVIGVVGTFANGLILYAMVASKQHRKHVLIFYQNALDVLSSLLLVITYAVKLCNFYLSGLGGYWLCILILSENILWCVILASKANLVFITIDRYVRIVYDAWSKKNLRKWMTYVAMVFECICTTVHTVVLVYYSSDVIDGLCYSFVIWETRASQLGYGIFYFVVYYVVILVIFIFCYWRILIAIRHQAQVMAGHGTAGPSASQARSHQIQSNIIKTMIFISAFYAITDLPMNVFYLMLNIHANLTLLDSGYYAGIFISFFYFCANPFIYAAKFDPVKRVLLHLIPCKKTAVQPIESIEITASATTRRAQTHK